MCFIFDTLVNSFRQVCR
uniref:Uncharacterized protein n=1 Tax=Rhizophora mucronata TaxID=61149 RepID=A0A2P2PAY2_RHIMU